MTASSGRLTLNADSTQRRRDAESRSKIEGDMMRRVLVVASIFILSTPFLALAFQDEPQPSQRLDPKIQKIVSEISADRIAEIEKKCESFETSKTLSDPTQPNRGVGSVPVFRVSKLS